MFLKFERARLCIQYYSTNAYCSKCLSVSNFGQQMSCTYIPIIRGLGRLLLWPSSFMDHVFFYKHIFLCKRSFLVPLKLD